MKQQDGNLRALSRTLLVLGLLCIPASFIAPLIFMFGYRNDPMPPPPTLQVFLTGLGIVSLLASLTMTACIIVASRSIIRRRRRTFCIVVSGLLCLSIPIGTAIGVWALILLNDPNIKKEFDTGGAYE
jgi:hypothetical protein